MYAEHYPWVYSYNHGWLYVYGNGDGGFDAGSWFYNLSEGAYWHITEDGYPWVYVYNEGWVNVEADTE